EQTVALSFLLAQKAEQREAAEGGAEGQGRALRAGFEVFDTVGKKAGQVASYFDLFGEEDSAQLEDLKDRAKPLSKREIEEILDETLPAAERAKIRRLVRVRGSASIKTVVEAELHDGRRVAVLVKRKHADELNAANIALAKAFVAKLRDKKVDAPVAMLENL